MPTIDPVIIDFAVKGMPELGRAFATVDQQLTRLEERATRTARRGSQQRVQAAKRETDDKERAYQKLQRDQEKNERRQTREAEREANRREMIVRRSSEYAGRLAAKQAAEERREADRTAREVERAEERKLRARRRSLAAVGRTALGMGGSMGGRLMGSAGTLAGAAMGIGGGFFLADAAREQLAAGKAAAQLANSATIGGKKPGWATVANITAQAGQIAGETGVSKTDLIASMQSYVAKSSDVANPLGQMRFFARMAQASGSRLEDITGAAGILKAQNKNLSNTDMQQMLLDMMEQGKQGAVEIQDMAHLAGALGSSRGLYAGDVTSNQRKLLALAQITRTESESPEEAATAVKDMGAEALKKRKKLSALGVKFTAGGQIQDLQQMIEASLTGTKGDQGKLIELFGIRGVKAFQRLSPIFNKAGGGQAGIEAVRKEMEPILNARGSQERLDQQYNEVMMQPAMKFSRAVEQIKNTVEAKLAPFLERLADKLPDLVEKVGPVTEALALFAKHIVDNPVPAALGMLAKSIGGVPGALATALAAGIAGIDWAAAAAAALQRRQVMENVSGDISAAEVNRKVRQHTVTAKDVAGIRGKEAALIASAKHQQEVAAGQAYNPLLEAGKNLVTGGDYSKNAAVSAVQLADSLVKVTLAARNAELELQRISKNHGTIPPVASGAPRSDLGNRPNL